MRKGRKVKLRQYQWLASSTQKTLASVSWERIVEEPRVIWKLANEPRISSDAEIRPMKYSLWIFASVLSVTVILVTVVESSGVEYDNATSETQSAASIFARRCASCHGRDGRANTAKGRLRAARDLTDAQWQADVSDERIFNSINNGRGKMPAYGKKLSEAAIDSLVSYVRSLKR